MFRLKFTICIGSSENRLNKLIFGAFDAIFTSQTSRQNSQKTAINGLTPGKRFSRTSAVFLAIRKNPCNRIHPSGLFVIKNWNLVCVRACVRDKTLGHADRRSKGANNQPHSMSHCPQVQAAFQTSFRFGIMVSVIHHHNLLGNNQAFMRKFL